MNIALITGASSGLGVVFAKQLDTEPDVEHFLLVARREARMRELAATLTKPCDILPVDLMEPSAVAHIAAWFASQQASGEVVLSWLINNAGLGMTGRFRDQLASDQKQMITLNTEVPVLLSQALLPYLTAGSAIVNVASVAAFLPQPRFATYAATKSMILSWSRALHQELRPAQIAVLACCPNPMATEFFQRSEARGEKTSALKRLGLESPERVVKKAILRTKKGRDISVTHPFAHLVRVAAKVLPTRFLFFVMRKLKLF